VSDIANPFNSHIDEFRISHLQRSDGWIETTLSNMSDPGAFGMAGRRSRKAKMASHRVQAPPAVPAHLRLPARSSLRPGGKRLRGSASPALALSRTTGGLEDPRL
jgi:hypothetical protein